MVKKIKGIKGTRICAEMLLCLASQGYKREVEDFFEFGEVSIGNGGRR